MFRLAILGSPILLLGASFYAYEQDNAERNVDFQKHLTPTGFYLNQSKRGIEAGGFPCNLATSPDGKFVVSTTAGQNQTLLVENAETGLVFAKYRLPQGNHLFFGLQVRQDSSGLHIASSMSGNKIQIFDVDAKGKVAPGASYELKAPAEENRTLNPAGLCWLPNGTFLVA